MTRVRHLRCLRRRGLRGVVLAGLLVAAQASAWLHAAAVAHATCLEHGETIHAGAVASTADGGRAEASAPGVRGEEPTASAHEHCDGGALLRFRDVTLSAPIAIAHVPTVFTSRLRQDTRGRAITAAVYVVAPKNSPPRTGV